ncbi:ELM2 domain family protein [Babesia bovis T2Bo]|uniref:ELM2 domain-containing protein n=1 Tax=Babesia bovis TaxID=5865 RepID=A7AQI1_BABBO|nr:ELM2 domain family protein [Babesia bovis T2Bo]EDO06800.1 ELM2 domain family protein [Babesia bovis T2Bo]BAN64475.1 hypothetical protein [Babesia bovis]|eukprot:XP_001610368.1 hypothetical protein [Babesia bovis T2Bo]
MEKVTKRQWMQSVNGKIRVGPEYQAMIPPFYRISGKGHGSTVPTDGSSGEKANTNEATTYTYVSGNSIEEQVNKRVNPDGNDKNQSKAQCTYLGPEDFLISH